MHKCVNNNKTSMQVNNMTITSSEMWMFVSKMQHHAPYSEWSQDYSSQKGEVEVKYPVAIIEYGRHCAKHGMTMSQHCQTVW